jgi:hypothetical protein
MPAGRTQTSARTGPTYRLAEFMNANWNHMVGRSNDDVASTEFGYRQGNLISMWRTGKARIPLEKLPDLARVMKQDIALLMPLWVEQYWGDRDDSKQLIKMLETRMVTSAEAPVVKTLRAARRAHDLAYTDDQLAAISAVISDPKVCKEALEAARQIGVLADATATA